LIKYIVKREIPKTNTSECGKKFKHNKIKVGKELKSKRINGNLMIVTRLGKQVCRVNSMLFNEHIEKLVTIEF